MTTPLLTVTLSHDGELVLEGEVEKTIALLASCDGKTPCPAIVEGMALCEDTLLRGMPTANSEKFAPHLVNHAARAAALFLIRVLDPTGLRATIERRLRSAAARNN